MATDVEIPLSTLEQAQLNNFDDYTPAATGIDEHHRLLHDGGMYIVSVLTTIANAGELDWLLRVKAGEVPPHVIGWSISSEDGPLHLRIFESPTVSVDGTPIIPTNQNRNYDDAAATEIYTGPTTTDDGDQLQVQYLGASGAGNQSSAVAEHVLGEEWFAKFSQTVDTDYLFRIENLSGGEIDISINFLFYETPYQKALDHLIDDHS